MSITAFQKLVTVSIWMFNNLFLYERDVCCQSMNYLTINNKLVGYFELS